MEELLQDFADKEVVYSATGEKLRVINSSSLWSVAGPIDYVKNYYPFGTPYSGDALADNPDHYNERGMSYTQNGALTRLLRYGKRNTEDFGLIDSLTITLDGNRVHSVNDGAGNLVYSNSFDFKHSAPKPYENPFIYRGSIYRYDDNGRLTYDPDKRALFSYDQTGNLKRFDRGSVIEYVYSSTGEKLCQFINLLTYAEKPTIFGTDTGPVITTGALPGPKPSNITSHLIYGQDVKLSHQHCTDFTGPFIIYYGKLDKFLFDGGYCTSKDGEVSFHYYQQDHLGNNRAVVSEDGTVEQTTEYYPFGGIYGDVSTSPGLQPYKYNGKMFVHSLGLDLYDYGARLYDPALVVWTGVDPLADEYGGISPYVYCLSNPVNNIDTDGKKVRPQGPEVLNMIVATLPKENRLYVAMDKDGYINNWLINNYKGNDYNTNCLKELVNNEMTMDVFITPNFAWKVGTQYRFSEEIYNLPNPYPFGEISINPDTNPLCNLEDLSTGEEGMMGKTLFPDDVGVQNSTNDNVQVYINPKLSLKGKAEIYSHEANGHVLRYFRNGYDHKNASHEIINGTERNNVLKQMILKSKIETINNFRK